MKIQNAIAAASHPPPWVRTPENRDQTLISFEQYIRHFKRYLNIAGLGGLDISQKWELLICTGVSQMEDLICHEAKVITEAVPEVVGVAYRASTNNTPERQAVQAVKGIDPTPCDECIRMCTDTIRGTTNELLMRQTLFTDMSADSYPDLRKWGLEIDVVGTTTTGKKRQEMHSFINARMSYGATR